MNLDAVLQAVRGMAVGHDSLVRCTNADCNDELQEGSAIGAVVYRHSDDGQWTVGRLYGGPCRPSHVRYPMVGTETHIIHARLGTLSDVVEQDHQLAIVAPEIVASSPPHQGRERANHRSYAGP